MTRKGPVDLSGMDRRFFEALSPGRAAVPSACAGDRAGREAGPGFLVAAAIVRRPLRPGISTGTVPPPPSAPPPHRNLQRAPGASPASSAAAKGSGGASLFRPSVTRTITRPSAPRAPRRSRSPERSQRPLRARPGPAASGSPVCGTAIMRSSAPAVSKLPPVPASVCWCRGARATCC
jgi:hypothetical protein